MKRWTIFTVIAVIASVCLVSSYAGININSSVSQQGIPGSRSSFPSSSQPAEAPASPYVGPNSMDPAPLDPNKVVAAVRAFPGLEQELTKVGKGSRAEVTEWRRLQDNLASATAVDNRSRLGREVQKQVALELGLLRKIAEEEGAKKTIAAIDGVLLFRQSRLEKLNKQMQDDRRSAATSLRSSRTSGTRGGGTTGSESSGRYAPSSRNGGQGEQGEAGVQEENTTISKRRR
jgi:hypothetical protein